MSSSEKNSRKRARLSSDEAGAEHQDTTIDANPEILRLIQRERRCLDTHCAELSRLSTESLKKDQVILDLQAQRVKHETQFASKLEELAAVKVKNAVLFGKTIELEQKNLHLRVGAARHDQQLLALYERLHDQTTALAELSMRHTESRHSPTTGQEQSAETVVSGKPSSAVTTQAPAAGPNSGLLPRDNRRYKGFKSRKTYPHGNGRVRPSRYGSTDIWDLGLCFQHFSTKSVCIFGKTCDYRHHALSDGERNYIVSCGQAGVKFLRESDELTSGKIY
ncbi:hypothetical protein BDV95DRAFT_635433 [Massariosphaeria phaeospora]|uniref:Uncharacterized protein n=1 Tax=Massariosphaeria phaeospora TaxID=100035 RepID=A0A7C8IFS9_9PLEO|nr:hypothetical protein BDV95DRAFT_635433 [Massariosphaeria phaeospora]